MRSKKFKRLIMVGFLAIFLSGCSLAKAVVAPLTPVKNTLPQKVEKSKRVVKCKGNITIEDGRVTKCDGGFYSSENTFNKAERKLTAKEKILQYVNRFTGYAFWIFVGLLFFAPGLIGVIFGRFFNGSVTAVSELVKGIKNGKRYIRNNGNKYTPDQKTVYQQALDDLMENIERTQSKRSKEIINKIRAKE